MPIISSRAFDMLSHAVTSFPGAVLWRMEATQNSIMLISDALGACCFKSVLSVFATSGCFSLVDPRYSAQPILHRQSLTDDIYHIKLYAFFFPAYGNVRRIRSALTGACLLRVQAQACLLARFLLSFLCGGVGGLA